MGGYCPRPLLHTHAITHYCQVTHADIKISMYHGVQNTI